MKVVIRLTEVPMPEASACEPSDKAVLRMNAFRVEHKALLDCAAKQMKALAADSDNITNALEESESYPAEKMPALLSTMYRHILALKLTTGTLDSLLEEEDDEVCMQADFMDDCVQVLCDSETFLEEANADFSSIVLGDLEEDLEDEASEDDDEEDEEDAPGDDEELGDGEVVCVFECDDPDIPERLVSCPKAQKALKDLIEAITGCDAEFD